jgi:hypothetical protein
MAVEPLVSLNAATEVGPGAVLDLQDTRGWHLMNVIAENGTASVSLEVSHDNENFFAVGSAQVMGSYVQVSGFRAAGAGVPVPVPARYVRANFLEVVSGEPSVTATVASC